MPEFLAPKILNGIWDICTYGQPLIADFDVVGNFRISEVRKIVNKGSYFPHFLLISQYALETDWTEIAL
jgi:hypothetical protein